MFAYGLAPFPSVHPSAKASTTLVTCSRDIKQRILNLRILIFLTKICVFLYPCLFVK